MRTRSFCLICSPMHLCTILQLSPDHQLSQSDNVHAIYQPCRAGAPWQTTIKISVRYQASRINCNLGGVNLQLHLRKANLLDLVSPTRRPAPLDPVLRTTACKISQGHPLQNFRNHLPCLELFQKVKSQAWVLQGILSHEDLEAHRGTSLHSTT